MEPDNKPSAEKKYWVPALERADSILRLIRAEPSALKLMDLSKRLDINKSSMFSLLHTLEALQWVTRLPGDTYAIGPGIGQFGSAYLQQFDLSRAFQQEAAASRTRIGETVQLACLDGRDILYLAKMEAPSPVRLASDPGMRLPAYATAMGKALLAELEDAEVLRLYPESGLAQLTPRTVPDAAALLAELARIRKEGLAYDDQEAVIGFCCVGAAVYDASGRAAAAVSFSMPAHQWAVKQEQATEELRGLARRLSPGSS
ncbi:IclR family transcriptional regulator [Paenibacillus sp. y28]|uniref:IclR family transcriptional regulator n=1 Tax=Paenibacillus sp. y28 TaxID=3129110 RepID=UPI00301A5CE4